MTDQTFEDKVQKIAAEMRDAMRREDDGYPYAEFLSDMGDYIKDLEKICARARPLPTLADMTPAERRACKWMQADVDDHNTRYVIVNPDDGDGEVALIAADGRIEWIFPEYVTPRPDLPRLEWPGKTRAAPALPGDWRLAEHPDHGRVIVTTQTPNSNGYVYVLLPDAGNFMGYDWYFCDPSRLTYIDQGTDTADTVPESTLAVGSVWHDADALARACEETGRDQIVVADKRGSVGVWDTVMQCWRVSAPHADFAPYTVIRAGKKDD